MTDAVRIRIARPEDAAAVELLLAASYPILMAAAYAPDALAAALAVMMRANPRLLASGTFYLAVAGDGAVIGCGGWTRERPGTTVVDGTTGHIRHFATDPACVRQGIGRALISHVVTCARAGGLTRLECYASFNAEPFYAACEFRRVDQVEIALEEGVLLPAVLMQRPI